MKQFKIFLLFLLLPFATFSQIFSDSVEICQGGNIDYQTLNPQAIEWSWSFGGGVPDTSTQQNPTNINYPVGGEFVTFCISTFPNGDKDTNYLRIKVKSDTLYPILLKDTIMCRGGTLALDAGLNNSSLNLNYLWTSPTLSIDDIFVDTRTLEIDKGGEYQIRIFTACNEIDKTITVREIKCFPNIYIPNAFTPEGNGLNETYSVYIGEYETFNLRLYSRWGEKIFETSNPNFRWDGTYKNTPVQPGVYVVVIEVSTESFATQKYMSTINVIR